MTWRHLPYPFRIVTLWTAVLALSQAGPVLGHDVAKLAPVVQAAYDDSVVESSIDMSACDEEGCDSASCDDSGYIGSAYPYKSPLPVPDRVGAAYITYPPFAPHEFLGPHSRTYRTEFPDGGYTKTKVSWSWRPWNQVLGRGPRVPCNPPHCFPLSNYWKLGQWGVDGRVSDAWGHGGMWR